MPFGIIYQPAKGSKGGPHSCDNTEDSSTSIDWNRSNFWRILDKVKIVNTYLGSKASLKCFYSNTQFANIKVVSLPWRHFRPVRMSFWCNMRPVGLSFWCNMLSETWYSDNVNVFKWPLYTTHLLNRARSRGGSESMLIRDCIDGESIPDYSCVTEDYEVPTILSNRHILSCLLPSAWQ